MAVQLSPFAEYAVPGRPPATNLPPALPAVPKVMASILELPNMLSVTAVQFAPSAEYAMSYQLAATNLLFPFSS
jgi:hypothetical protein